MIDILERIVTSNLVLICFTFLAGMSCSLLIRHDYFLNFAKVASVFIAFFLGFSFLFNVGEVYQFSEFYKRAFFLFGDGVGGALLFLIFLSVFYKNNIYFYILVAALAMTVSKISFILLIIGMSLLYFYSVEYRKKIFLKSMISIPLAFTCYIFLAYLSSFDLFMSISNDLRKISVSVVEGVHVSGDLSTSYKKQNYNNCDKKYECLKSQAASSLSDRYFSTVGGLWMTVQGDFMGRDQYPNSADKFAKLMLSSNPYNINEKYNLNYNDWFRMGQPQNPYVSFSSGYGVIGLFSMFVLVCSISIVALYVLPKLKHTNLVAYPVFYITYAVFNQTQLYINPFDGNLFVLGYCAGWVIMLGFFASKYKLDKESVLLKTNLLSKSMLAYFLNGKGNP